MAPAREDVQRGGRDDADRYPSVAYRHRSVRHYRNHAGDSGYSHLKALRCGIPCHARHSTLHHQGVRPSHHRYPGRRTLGLCARGTPRHHEHQPGDRRTARHGYQPGALSRGSIPGGDDGDGAAADLLGGLDRTPGRRHLRRHRSGHESWCLRRRSSQRDVCG